MTPQQVFTDIRREETRTKARVLPEWLDYDCERWWIGEKGNRRWAIIPDDAAALVLIGAMTLWLDKNFTLLEIGQTAISPVYPTLDRLHSATMRRLGGMETKT